MKIEIVEVNTKKLLREFIHLPAKIHQNHLNWVPSIYMDDWEFFNPKKNKAFEHASSILYLAFKNNNPVGRIMGIISHAYNKKYGITDARFCFFETYDDADVYYSLVQAVSSWAKKNGMNRIVGPLGFSDKDPQGWLIEGFDQPVVIASNCNFLYMNKLGEEVGFSKEVDLVVYQIPIPDDLPDFYKAIRKRFISKGHNLELK